MIEPPSDDDPSEGNGLYADVWCVEGVTFGVIGVIGSVDRFSDIPLFFHNFTVLSWEPVAKRGAVG